jgi:putative membrane protein
MHELYGTVFHRWYVSLFGIVYLWRASKQLGWRNLGIYTVLAVAVGALAENGSTHVGFPYTHYVFTAPRRDEVFVGSVPLMVPLSYTFMGYFAFAGGRLIASGPWRLRAPKVWQEYAVGLMLAVWALWVVDPVSRLGRHFFLGDLFHYAGAGFWFGLPLGSQVGFTATAAVLLGILTYLQRSDAQGGVAAWVRHPHVIALITYHGQVGMMVGVALWIGGPYADAIAGSALLMWVPAAVVTAVLWSQQRSRDPVPTAVTTGVAASPDPAEPVTASA